MYYTEINHCGHLRAREKGRKHEPQASFFYIFRVFFSQMSGLFYYSIIHGLGFFTCLMIIQVMWRKAFKHVCSMFYTLIKLGFWPISARARVQRPIYIIYGIKPLTQRLYTTPDAGGQAHSCGRSDQAISRITNEWDRFTSPMPRAKLLAV